MHGIWLNGKAATKVNAKRLLWGSSDRAQLYSIDGDERWISKRFSAFTQTSPDGQGELIIEDWLYKKLFQNE
jgi:hypothetical protein